MKSHTAWWTKLGGAVKHQTIKAIQNDARPKWKTPHDHGPARHSVNLLLLTDRREVGVGQVTADGEVDVRGLYRRGDDTEVNFVAYMYESDFLDCGMVEPPPEKGENDADDSEAAVKLADAEADTGGSDSVRGSAERENNDRPDGVDQKGESVRDAHSVSGGNDAGQAAADGDRGVDSKKRHTAARVGKK